MTGADLQQDGSVRGQRVIPGRIKLVRAIDADAMPAEGFGIPPSSGDRSPVRQRTATGDN